MSLDEKTFYELFELVPRLTVDAIILNDKRVLLVKRDVEPEINKWHFPGGFVHLNEKLESAVRRKALEETGLYVEVLDLFKVYEYLRGEELYDPRGHVVSLTYLCKPLKGKLRKNARFFSYSETPDEMGFGQRKYVEDLYEVGLIV